MVDKKIQRKKLILWRCRDCGALNLESLEWIKDAPHLAECLGCDEEYEVLLD